MDTRVPDRKLPARVKPAQGQLSTLQALRTIVKNPIEAWPAEIYFQPFVRSSFLGRDVVFVVAPELIGEMLVDRHDAFEKAETSRRILKPALGEAILTAEGARWRWQRRIAAPLFRPESVRDFVPQMLQAARETADRWSALPQGATISVSHEMMRTTFDVIVETMLSGRNGIDAGRVEQAITTTLGATGWLVALTLLGAPQWSPYPGRRKADAARAYLRAEVRRLVAERRRGAAGDDLIGHLMQAQDPETGESMSDDDIADNILTFIIAGHETTALALTWTFYLLSLHPEAAERVVAEVEAVSGGGELNPGHVGALAYTRQVVQEAMRLYPPAAVIPRKAISDLTLGEHPVKKGDTVYVPVYALHRHHALWSEPDRFDPERFAPDAVKARHRFAYMPFGAGPRVCIGMGFALTEAVAVLATLIRTFRLSMLPGAEPEVRLMVTLRPAGGMPMRAGAAMSSGPANCQRLPEKLIIR